MYSLEYAFVKVGYDVKSNYFQNSEESSSSEFVGSTVILLLIFLRSLLSNLQKSRNEFSG